MNMKHYRWLAIGWALFILFATIANTSTLEELSLQSLFAFDKPIHAFLFGFQAFLLIRTGPPISKRILWVCMVSLGYGMLTEVLQGLITVSRTFDWYDMLADGIGCLLVWLLYRRKGVAQ